MIKFAPSGHWYTSEGQPQHDADLRVARKKLLYPSVTSIDAGVFKNEFLDNWKLEQVALAAARTFRQPHEDLESYANRIYQDSRYKATTAAEFGERIHHAIEAYPTYPEETGMHPWIDQFGEWYNAHVADCLHRERVLVDHDIAVAGRCDFIGHGAGPYSDRTILCDWKTQEVKVDKKRGVKVPAFYESWPRQLAFYAVAYAKEQGTFPELPTCISVIIDSTEPAPPYIRTWTKEEIIDNYNDFVAGAFLWFSKRSYYPGRLGKWAPTFPFPMPM